VLASAGGILDEPTRLAMGRRFQHDFSDVVVHTNSQAAESTRAMNVKAYTVANHMAFADGEYRPGTDRGQHLIAHELAHVVQQRQGAVVGSHHLTRGTRNDALEREARDAGNAAVAGLPIARMSIAPAGAVQCADEQESLGFLDSPITEGVVGPLIGRTSFRVVREGIRGVVEGLRDQPPERGQRIVARFKQLDSSLSDRLDFDLGFLKGIGLGLFDSAKGLIDLVLLLPRLGIQAVDWITSSGPTLFQNFDRLSAKAAEVKAALSHVAVTAGRTLAEFVEHPIEALNAIKTGLDQLEAAAVEQVRIAGRAVVEKVYAFLELPFDQFGEKLGYVTGIAAFEVLFAVATEGIGTALKEAATLFSSGARVAAAEASRVLRLVIEVGGKAIRGLESFLKTAGKAIAAKLEELSAAIRKLFELLQDAVASLVPSAEPELAVAGGGKVPSNVLLSKGERVAGKGVGRTTTTTVEELRPRGLKEVEELAPPETNIPPEEVPVEVAPVVRGAAIEVEHLESLGYEKLPNNFKAIDGIKGGKFEEINENGRLIKRYIRPNGLSVKSTEIVDPVKLAEKIRNDLKPLRGPYVYELENVRVEGLAERQLDLVFEEGAVGRFTKETLKVLEDMKGEAGSIRFRWFVYSSGRKFYGPEFFARQARLLERL
jgi:hypothetical protein